MDAYFCCKRINVRLKGKHLLDAIAFEIKIIMILWMCDTNYYSVWKS